MTDSFNGIDPAHVHPQVRVLRSIIAKAAHRPVVDHNGNPLDSTPVYQYDEHGKLAKINGKPVNP